MLRSQRRACHTRAPPGADAIEHSPHGKDQATPPEKQRAQNHTENYLSVTSGLISINLFFAPPFKLSFVHWPRTNGSTRLAGEGTGI